MSDTKNSSAGRVKIQRPTTIHDSGDPTDDCLFDAKRVFRLIEDERYLSAEVLHESLRDRIRNEMGDEASSPKKPNSPTRRFLAFQRQKSKKAIDEKVLAAHQLLEERKDVVKRMEDRCRLFKTAKKNLDINADWTLAQTLFGVTTYYRYEADGSMSIKLAGLVNDCSLFDQVAVLREFDLNHLWAPFVTSSMTVAQLDKLDIVGWFQIGLPHFGLMRDALFRAIACDSSYEDGSILIVAYGIKDRSKKDDDSEHGENNRGDIPNIERNVSVDFDEEYNKIIEELREDPILDTLDLPPIPTRIGSGRLTIRSVEAQIQVESPTSAMPTLVANIDPNMGLIPQPLLDFVMKRVCGAILYKMKEAANQISKDPITNPHAIKIREEKEFYKTFLLPKFEGVCKTRGWEMPSVSSFGLSDAQLELAEIFKAKQKQKAGKVALRMLHTNNADSNLDEYLEASDSRSVCDGQVAVDPDATVDDGPRVRILSRDTDEMSEISKISSSSSIWRNNPIINFKRLNEERAQQRKDREIQESRERAAARLKPKSLSEDAKARLAELRAARSRQKALEGTKVVASNGPVTPSGIEKNERRWNISLANHGFFTKVFVLQFLMVSLFCLLYLDTAFNKVVAVREESFRMDRGRDVATLVYIGIAGFVHSIFCYIALMYAFTALQIGSIAGKRTRRFYGEHVHHIVGITSASMVGLGIIKPGLDKALRWVVWRTYLILKIAEASLVGYVLDKASTALRVLVTAIITLLSLVQKLVLESNIIGRFIVSVTGSWLGTIIQPVSHRLVTFVRSSIELHEGRLDALPWREDTFFTTRALLSHSAFFLLVLLILFNLAAKKARKAIDIYDETPSSNPADGEISSSKPIYSSHIKPELRVIQT